MIRSLLIIILCVFGISPYAQMPGLSFRNITTAMGLSHDKVNCILQDRRGFLWLGTEDGLNRYDGSRFQIFRRSHTDSSSLAGNIITDLHEDAEGILWIATGDGGLCSYDYRQSPNRQFNRYGYAKTDAGSVPINIVNDILEDHKGYLWLATSGNGVLRFDKKTKEMNEAVVSSPRTSLKLAIDKSNTIWVGRQGGGLLRIYPERLEARDDPRYRNVYAKMPHMTVAALFLDRRENLWMGSWDKVIYRRNLSTEKEEVINRLSGNQAFSDDPLAFAETSDGRIWIGGNYNGLYIYEPETGVLRNYQHDPAREGSLSNNQVNCIYEDKSNLVWIGTNQGVSVHDASQKQFVQQFLPSGVPVEHIYDFTELNGDLLIGTDKGIFVKKKSSSDLTHHPIIYKGRNLAVTKFHLSSRGMVFIGTNVSVFKINTSDFSIALLKNTQDDVVMKEIIESRIVSLVDDTIDSRPVLLAAPYGHLFAYYDFHEERWISRKDSSINIINRFGITDNLVRKLYKQGDGTIWLANAKHGLGEWRQGAKINYLRRNGGAGGQISSNNVYDLQADDAGGLWLTTYGGGLNRFDLNTRGFKHIVASHNLCEGIAVDQKSRVWLIANGNIHRYEPNTNTYTSYQLPDIEKTGGIRGNIFYSTDGKLYVAGRNYFIAFHPDSIQEQDSRSPVYFTDFRIFNRSFNHLLFRKEIDLRYNQNFFSVELSSPSFQVGYPVLYSHMLEGVDEDWIEDGSQNNINYTNLDGGNYVLKVRSTTKPGIWSDQISTLNIHISPPFWKTWWFYLSVLLTATGIIYSIYRYRVNEILKRQEIRNKIAQDLHDNLGSTLSSISVYGQVAKIYQSQNRHEALGDTLEKISTTSGEMISDMNDIVWAINPRNDSFELVIQRMESFARPLLSTRDISLHMNIHDSLMTTSMEMSKRKNFYLIFKEAVNNCLKYSQAKNIWVDISRVGEHLTLKVKDDGKGFDVSTLKLAHSLSGNGLENMRLRARDMRGTLNITSSLNSGTLIELSFPIP